MDSYNLDHFVAQASSDVPTDDLLESVSRETQENESKRPKRERKQRESGPYVSSEIQFVDPVIVPKEPKPSGRRRNATADGTVISKWDTYRSTMKKLLSILSRELHYIEGYRLQGKSGKIKDDLLYDELKSFEAKALTAKRAIIQTFEQLENENHNYYRWPELEAEEDDDGLIDLESIMCSVCGNPDEEGNDILFCDRAGCNRAYHQKCLNPPLLQQPEGFDNPDDTWFCWQCECIDDCIQMTNEKLELEITNWKEFFPELHTKENTTKGRDDDDGDDGDDDSANNDQEDEDEDEDEEEDEDYIADDDSNRNEDEDEDDEDEDDEDEDEDEDEDDEDENDNNEEDHKKEEIDENEEEEGEEEEEVDEEEVRDLLEESGLTKEEIEALGLLGEDSMVDGATVSTKSKYNLRKRLKVNRAVLNPYYSTDDIGRLVARVRRGYLILGKIESFAIKRTTKASRESNSDDLNENDLITTIHPITPTVTSSSSSSSSSTEATTTTEAVASTPAPIVTLQPGEEYLWTAVYSDQVKMDLSEELFRTALKLYYDYKREEEKQIKKERAKASDRDEQLRLAKDGYIDSANIIGAKRTHKSVDYVALSLQIFGNMEGDDDNQEDEGDDDTDDWSDSGKRSSSGSNKKRPVRSRRSSLSKISHTESASSGDNEIARAKKAYMKDEESASTLRQKSSASNNAFSTSSHMISLDRNTIDRSRPDIFGPNKSSHPAIADALVSMSTSNTLSTNQYHGQPHQQHISGEPFDSSDLFNLANDLISNDNFADAVEMHRHNS